MCTWILDKKILSLEILERFNFKFFLDNIFFKWSYSHRPPSF